MGNWANFKARFQRIPVPLLDKLVHWSVFSVIIALIPIIVDMLVAATRGTPNAFQYVGVKGEILIVCAGINAAAIGDLVFSSKTPKFIRGRSVAVGASITVILMACLWYANIKATNDRLEAERAASLQALKEKISLISKTGTGTAETINTNTQPGNISQEPDGRIILIGSGIVLVITLLAGGSCVALSEV